MPAGLPGSTAAQNAANPTAGPFVIFDPLSGPKGSPLDNDHAGNASTGALCTGIGCTTLPVINVLAGEANAAAAIDRAGHDDDQQPGAQTVGSGVKNTVNSTMMYIGGGRCNATDNGYAEPVPYTAGVLILGAGNGGSRDAGAGPAFTGFALKMVTATGAVTNGSVIETGWANRSGVTLAAGQSVYGSAAAATPAPS
jgi:hypothetical protein